MKRLLTIIAATAALTVAGAGAASAHPDSQYGGYQQHDDDDQSGDVSDYNSFQREYAHIMQGIQHGLGDGSFTRYQAQQYYRELRGIQRQAYYAEENGDYNSGWVQSRLERLHARMHAAHERGHERQDRYGDDRYGYGRNNPYSR